MSELENLVRLLLRVFPVYTDYIKSERLSYEFLANVYSDEELRCLLTGSFREGYPDLIRSDADFMLLLNPAEEILTLESQSRIIQPVVEAPAHVKLIIPRAYSDHFKENYHSLSTFLDLLEEDHEGILFISAGRTREVHERDFHYEFMADKKPSAPWTASETTAEGKASPAYTFTSLAKVNRCEVDRVAAIECMGWPIGASEWITRQPRNWPSTDLVESISKSGFMIVPKPSDVSGDTRKEWRLSFSEPEAKLFDSFSECQAKVYYLLRSLYARHLKGKLQGVFTSYHLKTVMFWILEEAEHSVWFEESTLEMYFRVLRKLLRFTKDGFCPHYFVRKHNLFYKTSESALEDTVHEISHVLSDPLAVFGNIVNEGFLGLMPRLGILWVEVQGKLNRKILSLPSHLAHTAITSPKELEIVSKFELECLSKTLEETVFSIKEFLKSATLIEVYITAILQGHQFAFTMGKPEAELAKIKSNSVMEDFFEMETEQINQSLLVWLMLGKVTVDAIRQGRNTELFSFFLKLKAVLRHQTGPLSDDEKQTLNTNEAIFSMAGGFLASVNFNATRISYQDLHELLCSILPSDGCGPQSWPTVDITLVLFVLAGATSKMAKDLTNI